MSSTATDHATLASAETVLDQVLTLGPATQVSTLLRGPSLTHTRSDSVLVVVVGRLGRMPGMWLGCAVSWPVLPGPVWCMVPRSRHDEPVLLHRYGCVVLHAHVTSFDRHPALLGQLGYALSCIVCIDCNVIRVLGTMHWLWTVHTDPHPRLHRHLWRLLRQ